MANFHTHFVGASIVGIAANSLLLGLNISPINHIIPGIMLVVLGGILPDIDSDHSDSIKIIFDIMAVLAATTASLLFMPKLGLLISIGIFIALFLCVRFGSIIPFRNLTSHRGIFHSIPMAILSALAVCALQYRLAGGNITSSWISGSLVLIGFITHLILDEVHSVNLANISLKKSFGTALCFYSKNNILGSLILYMLIVILIFIVPSPLSTWNIMHNSIAGAKWY